MTQDQWTELLGWCLVVNYAVLLISTVYLAAFREAGLRLHSRLFGLPETRIMEVSFQYLAAYKVLVLVFNLAPWLALQIM
ncbi:MAG: DUF6868 family protein [Minwuia sp.]|uniref:DUF6868 family protein n=1 Tax=Minwuia sp. TaxID=2493630 RepID=UPI003A849183